MKIIKGKYLEALKNYVSNTKDKNKPKEYESKDVWIDQYFKNENWSKEVDKKIYDFHQIDVFGKVSKHC